MSPWHIFFLLGLISPLLVHCFGHCSKTPCEVIELHGGVSIEVEVAQSVASHCSLLPRDVDLIRATKPCNHYELLYGKTNWFSLHQEPQISTFRAPHVSYHEEMDILAGKCVSFGIFLPTLRPMHV